MKLQPVILVGGSGTRLWPLSRATMSKQFLSLTSNESLLQETVRRLEGLPDLAAPLVICNHECRFLTGEQLQECGVKPEALVLEPVGRNTAPAVAIAALYAARTDPQTILLVLPSDHVVSKVPEFQDALLRAAELAQDDCLVTFGIIPTGPETGYGYLRRGELLNDRLGAYRLKSFTEKPDLETARQYLATGEYSWNSGMFVFRADAFLEELERTRPDILEGARQALEDAHPDLDFYRLGDCFRHCPAESIDYAVMEKTARGVVLPVEIGWSDIGSWTSLWAFLEKDADGNVRRGDTWAVGTRNCYLQSESRILAAVGVEDLVVVETPDAVLVAHKDAAQDVKAVVDQLKAANRTEHLVHRRVDRPWGSYEGVDRGDRFQVKRLVVKPGRKLSLQRHHHRSEHWVVVTGTAEVTIDDEVRQVYENQSIYIPQGAVHRLHNPGKIELHLVEVQSGAYLGEDDIVRLDDQYGRREG